MGKFGGTRGRVKKVACWSTKAAISMKRVKIAERLLWRARAYRKSQTFFRTIPSPTLHCLPFPKIGGSQPHPKTAITIISGTAKPKAREKFWRKGSVGHIQGWPKFFDYPYISGTRVKLRTSNLADIFTGSIRPKAR